MKLPFSLRCVRAGSFALVALALASAATVAGAVRAGGGGAPTESAVQGTAQEPAHVQADESSSLRTGTVGAIDERVTRVQVQGVWIELVAGRTQLLRNGKAAGLETLQRGEAIRFTVVPGTGGAPAMKVIYAP